MPVIDPHGLLEGARLAACSDMAQLYWPRLFCAANGYGRLELHFATIVTRCFSHMETRPTEDQFIEVISEYDKNCLAIVYPGGANWWMQFATESKYLRRWKTAEDERSPEPSAEMLAEFATRYWTWKEQQARQNRTDTRISEKLRKNFGRASEELWKDSGSPSEALPLGVGIGGGLRKSDEGLRKSEEEVSPEPASVTKENFVELPTSASRCKKPQRTADASPLGSLACVGGKSWQFFQADVDEWQRTYTAVDVMQQLRKMRLWLKANPKKLKTQRGMPKFVINWLGNAQDRGPRDALPKQEPVFLPNSEPAPRPRTPEEQAEIDSILAEIKAERGVS